MYYQGKEIAYLATCMCYMLLLNHSPRVQASEPVVIQVTGPSRHEITERQTFKQTTSHNISIEGDQFMVDGQPLHIISGSLHYFRLPAAYWRDRLRKLKAAGLNAVSTYVEWSYHEPEERQYSFEGDRDVAQFVRTAAEEGLHVLLRPGPYICAERDLGGLPYWLLGKYRNMELRTTNKDFIEETRIWISRLFKEVSPLLFGNGGPILLVQVENEYGSYGSDKAYLERVRDIMLEHVGTNALLYTTDGTYSSMFQNGAVSGALTTIDFGVGYKSATVFRPLRQFMPSGPLMNSEFYPGWLTHWGEGQQQVPKDKVVRSLRDMLDNKINVNFYVFFGGTNFEFSAGANYDGTYKPDVTSYDYDAPLNEAGDPTLKYYAIRDAIAEYDSNLKNITPPAPSPKGRYGTCAVSSRVNLLSPEGRTKLGKKYNDFTGVTLPTFEELRQRAGLVLYETTLKVSNGLLHIEKPRDWIYVYVDGEYQGYINRMNKIYSLPLILRPSSVLSLLVETQGRINYGNHLHDYKGILGTIDYNGNTINATWSITGYPLEVLDISDASDNQSDLNHGPVIYEGHFSLPTAEAPLDTFVDPTGWGKGYIWINGHNLGRYWPTMGPQVTLYVPGVWLQAAPALNHLQILELAEAPSHLTMEFIDHPIWSSP